MKKNKPNIILISIDTLRADHLSCYGYEKETTPNIDRIAAGGKKYMRNYSTGVWTPPGHASMLTGLYVVEHGVCDDRRLHSDIPTIATILKQSGYQTAGFVNNSQVGALVGFEKGHDVFEEIWRGIDARLYIKRLYSGVLRKVKSGLKKEDMGAGRTNKLFFRWIESIDKNKPFYAFLHYIEPHNPLSPPNPFRRRFLRQYKGIDKGKVDQVAHNPLICYVKNIELSSDEISYLKDLYDAEIAYIDHVIGQISSFLKKRGLYENTMIVITSDHGEHFGEYGCWSHVASLYNEVLHVPLIIKYPLELNINGQYDGITQLVDILPTILDVAELTDVIKVDSSGVSLLVAEENDRVHEFAFSEWEGRIPIFIRNKVEEIGRTSCSSEALKIKMSAIQNLDLKLIRREDGHESLYDVSSGHEKPIDENAVDEAVITGMRAGLAEFNDKFNALESVSIQNHDEEVADNLRSLGYM